LGLVKVPDKRLEYINRIFTYLYKYLSTYKLFNGLFFKAVADIYDNLKPLISEKAASSCYNTKILMSVFSMRRGFFPKVGRVETSGASINTGV
jgi:hypothetical protein